MSINSEKVAEILETIVLAPSVGLVEATVGAVVSMVNEVKVMVFPTLLSISDLDIVQFE